MINIIVDKPNKIKPTPLSPLSGYITFKYDTNILAYIKSLGNRVYIPETKEWEVPASVISQICNDLVQYQITLTGRLEESQSNTNILPPTYKFKTVPFAHQIEGVIYGLNHNTFLLGDEQGLGKTKQAIDLALIRKSQGCKHCLIICGVNSVKYNWAEEIKLHSNESSWVLGTRFRKTTHKMYEGSSQDKLDDLKNLPSDYFLITNIETLRQLSENRGTSKRKKMYYPIAEQIKKLCDENQIGMIIFDECHKAKNPTSNQGEAMLKTSAQYMLALSGTPLMNNPLDLYFPLRWLGYENHSFYEYKNHYCIMGGFNGQEVMGFKNLGELRQTVDTIMLRRRKDDVLDLPAKMQAVEYVDMYPDQAKVYAEVKQELKANINKIKVSNNPLAEMIRLRQATAYPGILSTKITESAKMDRMVELVEEITSSGRKAIIFSNWSQVTDVAREKLKSYNPCYITGDTSSEDRMNQVGKFQNDSKHKVIIGTMGAMGTGLTLTAASYVIFLDSPWNRALKDQCEDRAHRIGTTGTVNIITLMCKDTIDEKIEELVYKKGVMADKLIDGKLDAQSRASIVDALLS